MIAFIDDHRETYGVEPICRVLPIAPSTWREHAARHLYEDIYCARGQAENLIKLHKTQLASDRTSCQSPVANQVRLVLHTAAYWLMLALRPHQLP